MTPTIQIGKAILNPEELLQKLITYQLLPQFLQEFVIDQASQGITLTAQEAETALQQFRQNQGITSPAQETQYLQAYRMTPEQLQQRAQQQAKVAKFKQVRWGHGLDAEFMQKKQQYDRYIYSLLRTQNPDLAQELYFRLREGEAEFSELARQYSQGSEKESGGLIGPVEARTLHPQLVQMLATTPIGKILPPTILGEWVVIVRPEKVIPAQLDQEMRERLLDQCWQQWLHSQAQALNVTLSPVPAP